MSKVVSEEQEYDPRGRAKLDLTAHVLVKGVQAGAVAGSLLVALKYLRSALRRGTAPTLPGLALTLINSQAWGVVVAAFMELGLAFGKQIDEEGFEDRAYRLYYNKGQNRTDRFAGAGYAAGAVAGVALGGMQPAMIIGFGGIGCTGGILAHIATSSYDNTPSVTPE